MGGAALLGCAGLIIAVLLGEGGLSVAANIAQLVSIMPIGVALLLWLWQRPPALTKVRLSDEIDVLSSAVTAQWKAENALRTQHGLIMPIHWRVTTRDEVQAHPATITERPLFLLDAVADDLAGFVDDFRALSARRVVLLGDPGAGKTTAAVRILLALLAARTADEPVPVLVTAAGWDPNQDLRQWFITKLSSDYPALREAKALVEGGHVLPIFDGVDELPTAAQAAMITQVNRSFAAEPVILTCRTAEFTAAVHNARQVVDRAVVLEPEPLNGNEIADYLERCMPPRPHPGWAAVCRSLRSEESALRAATSTPLGLWLICEVYLLPRTEPDDTPLPFPDPMPLLQFDRGDDLIDALLRQFVPAVVASRPPSADASEPFRPRQRRDPERTGRWLGHLATMMGTSRDLMWWRLTGGIPIQPARWPVWVLALIGGLAVAIPFGSQVWVTSPLFAVLFAALLGIVLTVLLGKTTLTALVDWQLESPASAEFRLRGRSEHVGRQVRAGVPVLVLSIVGIGAIGAVVASVSDDLSVPIFAGASALVLGLPLGLWAAGLITFTGYLAEPGGADSAGTPLQSWKADRALQLIRSAGGALFALMPVTLLVLIGDYAYCAGALLFCVWITTLWGRHHAWLAYVFRVRRLARRGHVPRDLMYFLDDCHRMNILRAVGPVYQFRHAALQDHLARKWHDDFSRQPESNR